LAAIEDYDTFITDIYVYRMKYITITARLCILLLILPGCLQHKPDVEHRLFYAGSSDIRIDHSIFLCSLDYDENSLRIIDSFPGSRGSSYLALSDDQQFLYAIDKRLLDSNSREQTLSAYRVDADSYLLEYLNSQSSRGSGPCHVHCNSDRSYIFTANYGSGSVAAFPLSAGGQILNASDLYTGTGSGPDTTRQKSPHMHYVTMDPGENFVLAVDLGTDRVLIFRLDKENGRLIPNSSQPYFQTAPGAGPRHLAFHPDGDYLFILNELNGTLTACGFDKDLGLITEIMTHSTLPDGHNEPNKSAAVRVHPGGRFVYASNRGKLSSIAVFRIQKDGSIRRIQVFYDIPAWPRDFNIDPQGKILLAAGEHGNEIEVFRINNLSGKISPAGGKISIPSPGNIVFVDEPRQ
jgi:6-phosphogluconolactonase